MYDPTEYRGCTISISPDDHPCDPRDGDNLGTMVCSHRRYNLGDRDVQPDEIEDVLAEFGPDMISLPLYLYDHSGITMNTTGFACPWDSGQVGLICVSLDTVRKEYGEVTDHTRQLVNRALIAEVDVYDQYLRGDVYGFTITYRDGTEDSLVGLYGYDECLEEAREWIDCATSHLTT